MVLDMFTDMVYASGRNVAAQSGDAEALSEALLQDIQDAAASVLPDPPAPPGLNAIGQKVYEALVAYATDWVQPNLVGLLTEIVELGDGTSGSAVVVDETDLLAYEDNLAAAEGFDFAEAVEISP